MAAKKFIKPSSPGLVIRDPLSKERLHADGDWKPMDSYWRRRIIDGAVIEVAPPSAPVETTQFPKKNERSKQ